MRESYVAAQSKEDAAVGEDCITEVLATHDLRRCTTKTADELTYGLIETARKPRNGAAVGAQ